MSELHLVSDIHWPGKISSKVQDENTKENN